MRLRTLRLGIGLVLAIVACEDRRSGRRSEASLDTPEALWRAYREAHAGATRERAVEVGRRIEGLLTESAVHRLTELMRQMMGRLPSVRTTPEELRHRFLGEMASVRRGTIEKSTLASVSRPQPDHAVLTASDGRGSSLVFEAVHQGKWRLAFSPDLLGKEEQLFPTPPPPKTASATGGTSVAQVAQRWCDVLNSGDGWAAYGLFDSASKQRLLRMITRVGGSGERDVVRVLEKTVRDRQARGLRCRVGATRTLSAERGQFEIAYTNGRVDKHGAVYERGAWWVAAPF
jgi:hypothetical protein